MLDKILQQLGMSDKEAKVYLAALELGSAPMQIIAHKAGVNRATTYVHVEELIKKGLMSSVIRGKKRYFNAEPPEQLVRLLEIKKKDLEIKQETFEKHLPEFQALFNLMEEKPKVRFFEGIEGIKAIQKDILTTKSDEIKEITDLDASYEIFPPASNDHRSQMRTKFKDVNIKALYTSKRGAILSKEESSKHRRIFISFEEFNYSADIVLYGENKTAFININKRNGVVIENKEIFGTLGSLFNLTFESFNKNK